MRWSGIDNLHLDELENRLRQALGRWAPEVWMHRDGEHGSAAARHTGRLAWALGLTATYMFAEFAGSLITGSLALLADAAHMLRSGRSGAALIAFASLPVSRHQN